MINEKNLTWVLRRRPVGDLREGDLELVESALTPLEDGQVRAKTIYLSLDPTNRIWMSDMDAYLPPVQIGDAMRGGGLSVVTESRFAGLAPGDIVNTGLAGWSVYNTLPGAALAKLPKLPGVPLTAYMGPLGATGMTAYFGLMDIAKPKAGETVVVSAAAGAVGSMVGQIAKIQGCRVVGIAGGQDKCDWLVREAGYDAAIDYKAGNVKQRIRELCPRGVDVIYDNVGGKILNDMLACIATGARVVICGGISRYETGTLPAGPENYFNLVFRRGTMAGFIVLDWASEFPGIRKRLEGFVKDGSLKYQEDIQHGFENAPQTLQRLFGGLNRGKQMLKL